MAFIGRGGGGRRYKPTLGDEKTGWQSASHDGWVIMQGQATSSLTTTQQAACATLGIVTNLPDMRGAVSIGKTAGDAMGATVGANSAVLASANLPNAGVNYAVYYTSQLRRTATNGGWDFNINVNNGVSGGSPYLQVNGSGNEGIGFVNSQTTATTGSINGGVPQTALDLRQKSIVKNFFIYLGK